MDIKLSFTDKEITLWSGMIFIKKLLDKTGLVTELIAFDLPDQGSNGGYKPV